MGFFYQNAIDLQVNRLTNIVLLFNFTSKYVKVLQLNAYFVLIRINNRCTVYYKLNTERSLRAEVKC